MKKITLIFFLLSTLVNAQISDKHFARVEFDPKLAILGAYSYDATPVIDVTLSFFTQLENYELGITTEYANLKDYYFSFGFIYNRVIPLFYSEKIQTLLGIETLCLQRGFRQVKTKEWLTAGLNAEIRYYAAEHLAFTLRYNYKYRPDINMFKQNGNAGVAFVF